jgi:hypothetical protein
MLASTMTLDDPRRHSPATARNREPILDVLRRVLSDPSRHARRVVLEIASGNGEHAVFLAPRLGVTWQPSDPNPAARASIDAHAREMGPSHPTWQVLEALDIDVTVPCSEWPSVVVEPDIVVCINMIHIAPWRACEGLLDGASHLLPRAGGILYLYGPYRRGGAHTAPSNEAFDRALREQDPSWGVRDVEEVVVAARTRGLQLVELTPMPANNLSLVFAVS